MTALPIIQRELLTRARQGATYWARSAIAALALLALLPSLTVAGPFSTPARVGRFVFDGIVAAAFLLSCSVCLLTADAISSERREGTLGLLFLTRVKSFDVLLGKLGSVGLTSFCALLVFLPVLMIPVVAGGVTGGEAARKGVGLLGTLMLSLSVGLYASASQQERVKAWRQALLIFALLVLLPAWMVGMWGPWGALPPQARVNFVGLLSPILLLYNAGDLAYRSAPAAWWFSLLAVTCVSFVLVARAAARLRPQVDEIPPAISDIHEHNDTAATGPGSRRWNTLASRLSPVAWLVTRQRGLSAAIWSAALLGLVFQIALYPFYLGWYGGFRSPIYMTGLPSLTISVLTSSLIAWSASRFFIGARRTGELELLMSTPLGAERIVTDQWQVLKGMLAGPVLLMVAPLVLRMLPVVFGMPSPVGAYARLVYGPAIFLVIITNSVLGVCALCWLGMWFGLRARGQASAIVWAVGVGTGLPFLWNLVSWPFIARFVVTFSPGSPGQPFNLMRLLPHLVVSAFYVWMIISAKRHLLQHLAEPQPGELTLHRVFSDAVHETSTAFRHTRHWTPH